LIVVVVLERLFVAQISGIYFLVQLVRCR
jgi:hypothetical protein